MKGRLRVERNSSQRIRSPRPSSVVAELISSSPSTASSKSSGTIRLTSGHATRLSDESSSVKNSVQSVITLGIRSPWPVELSTPFDEEEGLPITFDEANEGTQVMLRIRSATALE